MFKSELVILIFLLVILFILLLNSNNFEYFKTKENYELTIKDDKNKKIIIDNINIIIQLLNNFSNKYQIIKKHRKVIEGIIQEKIALETILEQLLKEHNILETALDKNVNEKLVLDNNLRTINSNINGNSVDLNNKKLLIKDYELRSVLLNKTKNQLIQERNNTNNISKINELNKNINSYEITIHYYKVQSKYVKSTFKPLEDKIRDLYIQRLEVSKTISEKKLEIEKLNQNIISSNADISKENHKIQKVQEKLSNNEDILNDNFIVTFAIFSDLNTELESLNLKNIGNVIIIEDFKDHIDTLIVDIENLKLELEKILKDFKKTNKIGFGKLKTCKIKFDDITFDNKYREHILLDDKLSDNTQLKNMYYQVPIDNLKKKTNHICDNKNNIIYDNSLTQKNVENMCKTKDYMSSCLLLYNQNKIIDSTDNYIVKNNKCYKRIPFTKQIPYTKIKLPCTI